MLLVAFSILTPSPRNDFFKLPEREPGRIQPVASLTLNERCPAWARKTALILRFERYSTLCASKEEIQR